MKKLSLLTPFLLAPALLLADENATAPVAAAVAAAPKLDGANTAWVLMATALVMLMTPAGLALFYGGMTIGFYWPQLTAWWHSISRRTRRITLGSMWVIGAATLLYNVAIMLSTMGYDMSAIGATPQLQHDLYVTFFDKERLPLSRIALFMLWFWGWFALVRIFEKPILCVLGWLLIPYGTNSLYVYTVQAFIIFFAHLYFSSGSLLFNFFLSVIFIIIPLVMLRYNILGKIIPR